MSHHFFGKEADVDILKDNYAKYLEQNRNTHLTKAMNFIAT
jgi:hypothetical protein